MLLAVLGGASVLLGLKMGTYSFSSNNFVISPTNTNQTL